RLRSELRTTRPNQGEVRPQQFVPYEPERGARGDTERSPLMSCFRSLRFPLLVSLCVSATVIVAGCSGHSTLSAQFAPSVTAPAPGLVKLVERSRSGSRVL